MYKYTAFDVACHIVNSSIDAGQPVSNLQLQKILYFVQVGYLESKDEFLFGEDFEAWQYGPVIPSIYRLFAIWGGSKITKRPSARCSVLSLEDSAVIDPIIARYRLKAPWDLVAEAHAEGKPWHIVMESEGDRGIITKNLIRQVA